MIDATNTVYIVSGDLPADFLANFDRSSSPLLDFVYVNKNYKNTCFRNGILQKKVENTAPYLKTEYNQLFLLCRKLIVAKQKHQKLYSFVRRYWNTSRDLCNGSSSRVNIVCQLHGFLFPSFYFQVFISYRIEVQVYYLRRIVGVAASDPD